MEAVHNGRDKARDRQDSSHNNVEDVAVMEIADEEAYKDSNLGKDCGCNTNGIGWGLDIRSDEAMFHT